MTEYWENCSLPSARATINFFFQVVGPVSSVSLEFGRPLLQSAQSDKVKWMLCFVSSKPGRSDRFEKRSFSTAFPYNFQLIDKLIIAHQVSDEVVAVIRCLYSDKKRLLFSSIISIWLMGKRLQNNLDDESDFGWSFSRNEACLSYPTCLYNFRSNSIMMFSSGSFQ